MVIRRIFKKEGNEWLKSVVALMIWDVAATYLLHFYGLQFTIALVDTITHTALLLCGFLLLENVFKYYLPRQAYSWLGLIFPLILTALVAFLANSLLLLWFRKVPDYQIFLERAFWIRIFVMLLIFYGFTLLMWVYNKLEDQFKTLERKEMIEKMSKESELVHLRQQLQPHFLFNSLNSISALVHKSPEKAREMVLQLSDFLRGTIRKKDQKWVVMEEELEYLELYLNIERVRFGQRLQVDFQVEKEALSLKIPPLMIQPLLENAVKHGLHSANGEVKISVGIKRKGNYLEVSITNPYDRASGKAEGTGFGLDAVTRRLYLMFGRHDLIDYFPADNLFTVWIKIPQMNDQDHYNR